MHKDDPKDFLESLSPMGRIVDVQDNVEAVLYLTEARQVTGEVLHIAVAQMWANGNRESFSFVCRKALA